jgi:hypothetical protein
LFNIIPFQDVFKECIEYFGESSRNADAIAFFSLLVRFVRAFKVSRWSVWLLILPETAFFSLQTTDQENEQRRRLEAAAKNNRADQKRQQVTFDIILIFQQLDFEFIFYFNRLKSSAN